jgi:DNA ligase-1
MKAFSDLYTALDETNKNSEKIAALVRYFTSAPPADAAWAVYFLIGRKPRQVVPTRKLREWAARAAGIPDWLFDECYHAIGDLAETLALVLPESTRSAEQPLHIWIEQRLLSLREMPEREQQQALLDAWRQMNQRQRYVWNKLITGSFRVGVSQASVTRALARVSDLPPPLIAHRLMGDWTPSPRFYARLLSPDGGEADVSRPYPFFLAHPLSGSPEALGDISEWQIEWKWDGIRAQLIRRAGQTFLWSRGEELVTARYPEIVDAGQRLPDGTVIDGEILAWREGVLPFGELQRRIGRKTLGKKLLDEVPVVLLAYDLLEDMGEDVRRRPLARRRMRLSQLIGADVEISVRMSPLIEAESWTNLEALWTESRRRRVEGMMLKRLDSPYRVGRVRGDWWKWKIGPHTIDAVLIYAQRGSGKRASLYTDYTFAVWDNGALVPIAKAYSGLTDAEIRQVDAFVRRHTTEKFGPVRTVTPEHVFELGFEGIQRSSRHKCGLAVRFPRILRWRTDKKPEDANTLADVKALLDGGKSPS